MKLPLIDIKELLEPTKMWFLEEPATRLHHTEGRWLIFRTSVFQLTEDFVFGFTVGNKKYTIVIRKGFLFDFASTPRILHLFYPPNDQQWGRASLVHDMAYRAVLAEKWFNDLLLCVGMGVCKAPRKRREIFHAGVALFGWIAYLSHTEQSVKDARDYIDINIEDAA